MKKIVSLFLCFIFCVSMLLTGCGGGQDKDAAGPSPANAAASVGGGSNLTAPGTFPIVNQPVTLKMFMAASVEDIEKVFLTKYYEKKTNVHVEWQIAAADAKDKINLMLASNSELPDVIMPGSSGAITNESLFIYGMSGAFLPLNDLVEKQGYFLKKAFAEFPDFKKQVTAPDGKIYGLMEWNQCYHCWYSQRMWVNTKWMDKLALKIPTTTDEFYTMLKAFKEKDPNGNGKQDEIPLMGSKIWRGNVDGFLMNPFIYNDGADRLNVADGKVFPAFTQPEWKEGLKYLNKLHNEGLLDKESFVADEKIVKPLNASNRLGAVAGGNPKNFVDMTANPLDKSNQQYTVVPPIKGPTGKRQAAYFPTVASNAKFVITKYCKNPEVALRWADGFYDESDYNYQGEENVHWRKAKAGEIGFEGKPAKYDLLDSKNAYWAWAQPFLRTNQYRNDQVYNPDVYNNEKVLYDSAKPYEGLGPKEVFPPIFMTKETAVKVAEYKNTVNTYVNECTAKFITGNMKLDTDWDKYLAELKKMGLEDYIAVMQKSYEEYKKK